MNKLRALFLLIAFITSSNSFGGYEYKVDDDKFEGTKTEWIEGNRLDCSTKGDVRIFFQPKKISKGKTIVYKLKLGYISVSNGEYYQAEWLFINQGGPLKILADGKKITLNPDPGSYHEEVFNGGLEEEVQYSVPAKFFEKLALANAVEAKISGEHYYLVATFNKDNHKNFDRFYQEVVLSQKYQENKTK